MNKSPLTPKPFFGQFGRLDAIRRNVWPCCQRPKEAADWFRDSRQPWCPACHAKVAAGDREP